MKEKGILFNGPMVRAILEGRKTQTRRMMKPQPELRLGGFWHFKDCQWADGGLGFPKSGIEDYAPYLPGDRLWVRETFRPVCDDDGMLICYDYRADPDWKWKRMRDEFRMSRWRPNIHMPRAASRITLEVTDVLAEQVQSISVADALAEGVLPAKEWLCPSDGAIPAFADLWEKTYGPSSWESNPWLWVFCFKVLEVKK